MLVTINTDASFHPKYKLGAYAFWIVCAQGKILHSGPLKEAKDPTDAEMRCIANALHALLKSNFTEVHKVIINSDALYAFTRIGRSKPAGSPGRIISNILRDLKKKYFSATQLHLSIHEFRHVKAHSGTENARKWVNDWCDKTAKRELGKLIRSKTSNQ